MTEHSEDWFDGYAKGRSEFDAVAAELESVREAVRGFLNGAPLDENGRFKDARLEALYRAVGGR